MSDQMKKVLDDLAPTFKKLADKKHDIIVEGHTDNVPIRSSQFASNWELSSARATTVVQYLIQQHHYPPVHIAAVGYGEFRSLPQASDEDLDAWRSKNRRVVFVVKNPDPGSAPEQGPPSKKNSSETAPAEKPAEEAEKTHS